MFKDKECRRCLKSFTPTANANRYCVHCLPARKIEKLAEKRAYDKIRHLENREERCKYVRSYYAVHREAKKAYDAEYRKRNPDKRSFHEQKRQVVKRGCKKVYPFTKDQLEQRMAACGNVCWICQGAYEEVDHVKPISKGGLHILCNLRPICKRCNRLKRNTWPFSLQGVQWIQTIGKC